jgi:hypothetical protein
LDLDFKKDLQISQYQLDLEWLKQPGLVEAYNRAWADAVLKRNKAKERLEVVEAELDLRVRKQIADGTAPEELVKPTEGAIGKWVKLQQEYRQAQADLFAADHEVNILVGGTKAFSAKGDALKGLTQLILADRYSSPSAPEERKLYKEGVDKGSETTAERLEYSLGTRKRKLIRRNE